MTVEKTFTKIYEENAWFNEDTRSGPGSDMGQTNVIRHALPILFEGLGIKSILDIPCGDYFWWKEMSMPDTIKYIGADIVEPLIESNKKKWPQVDFRRLDIIKDDLPTVDLVFVRDCLGHFSNFNVNKALENIKRSGSLYLMATHFPDPKWRLDADIIDGGWRPINLDKQFGLGDPYWLINEGLMAAEGAYKDKSLGLWRLK